MIPTMPRQTLLDLFEDFAVLDDVFLVHDDGYRARQVTYRELGTLARAFAHDLRTEGIAADDKVVIWSENRIEWVAALWGCLLARAVLVPVDYRASADLVRRIADIVRARAILVGEEVATLGGVSAPVWRLAERIDWAGGLRPAGAAAGVEPTHARAGEAARADQPGGATLAEIIFTSGATAEPKGVTITHRNILANVIPIEREIHKYLKYERPFHPIRFLNLLPLSHMFGQSMAAFIPPLLGGTVIFSHGYNPQEILRQIKPRRVSVLVCVPKVLDVLREYLERVSPETAGPDRAAGRHWLWRWWYYRAVHRRFGWKFWCIVVGAAPLPPELEAFWRKLGFVVVQGYGLTETAPVVTLNHPFRASRGTVGAPIAGVEVRIAPDGEILVRGENVTSGYFNAAAETAAAFEDGWFHTGDVGELDSSGRLIIKGRKKEMIVTAQGLNVFPEDVERALLAQPGVKDAGVVGIRADGEERVHAVLVLEPGADLGAIVRAANATLEDHQRVWSSSVWPSEALPRTEGTQKLKRLELQRWASGERREMPARGEGRTVEAVVSRLAGGREVTAGTTMDELGLSSLDRVELMMALEETFQTTLDETMVAAAKTVGDLRGLIEGPETAIGPDAKGPRVPSEGPKVPSEGPKARPSEPIAFPAWNRSGPSWLVRRASLPTWILPLGRVFVKLTVEGRQHLAGIGGPVVFAANHQSHLDTPVILMALPARWRYRVMPAMAKEFFAAHFDPATHGGRAWFTNSLNYYLAAQFFGAFPLPQREAGTRQTLRYIGEIAGDGYSILIFPEGRRTERGEIQPFRPGVGMIASRLDLPVVPVRLEGLERVLHQKMKFPKRGPVRVAFGEPLRLEGDDYPALANRVEDAVRRL
jgi:long-chain acyl-CoA synthetase